MIRLNWQGFATAAFLSRLFTTAVKASGGAWFALSASSFGDDAYMILKSGKSAMVWEYS